MIGSSNGEQYGSEVEAYVASTMSPKASRMPADASNSNLGTQIHVDREHDVPLAASALHKDGQMYGIAIDKDAPINKKYDSYIYKHESDEFGYMQDLIKTGMDTHEAYKKAHDHITPMESARVQADLGEKGLEDYKQYWRDVTSVSSKKENPNRHPDAHTTTYKLDEAELGKAYRPFEESLKRETTEDVLKRNQPTFEERWQHERNPDTIMNPFNDPRFYKFDQNLAMGEVVHIPDMTFSEYNKARDAQEKNKQALDILNAGGDIDTTNLLSIPKKEK